MRRFLSAASAVIAIAICWPGAGRADDARLSFAVASIKPSRAPVPSEHDGRIETSPGSLQMQDVTVSSCIKWAYGVQDNQIAGFEPRNAPHYDIAAKADDPVDDEHLKLMMRTLLADRFKLTFHRQTKDLSGYALVPSRTGVKFHETAADGQGTIRNSQTGFVAKSVSMRELADFISGPLAAPVVHETGMTGKYDLSVNLTAYVPSDLEPGKRPDITSLVFAGMQGELGLKFEARKIPVEVMVIDHVENPSEN